MEAAKRPPQLPGQAPGGLGRSLSHPGPAKVGPRDALFKPRRCEYRRGGVGDAVWRIEGGARPEGGSTSLKDPPGDREQTHGGGRRRDPPAHQRDSAGENGRGAELGKSREPVTTTIRFGSRDTAPRRRVLLVASIRGRNAALRERLRAPLTLAELLVELSRMLKQFAGPMGSTLQL